MWITAEPGDKSDNIQATDAMSSKPQEHLAMAVSRKNRNRRQLDISWACHLGRRFSGVLFFAFQHSAGA
jgi:hypothetical protein